MRLASAAQPMINRVVWSFWSAPYRYRTGIRWGTDFSHLLSWVLSFRLASQLVRRTALVTDSFGYELLVEELGLPFDEVSISLDVISNTLRDWWVLGKLYAYREQTVPFVHIDNDVFLRPGFPANDLSGQVIAQNPEYAPVSGMTYYKPSSFAATVATTGGWLPRQLVDYISRGGETALCTGVFGGLGLPLIHSYADLAIRLIESHRNRRAWAEFSSITEHAVLVEQYFLGAMCCADAGVDVQCLFKSQSEAFRESAARRLRYTHLMASAKQEPRYMRWLADRVRQDFPQDFETVLRLQALAKSPPLA